MAVGVEGAIYLAWTVGEDPAADIHFVRSDDDGRSFRIAQRVGDDVLGKTVGAEVPFKGSISGQVAKSKRATIIQGFSEGEFEEKYPETIDTYKSGVRSWLCIPLVNRGDFAETLVMHSTKENAFNERDADLAQRVGNQIAGAIGGARLFAELKRTETALATSVIEQSEVAAQNEVIAEIGRIIGSTLNIDEVYEHFTDQVRKLIAYDVLGISVFEPDGHSSRIAHRVGDSSLGQAVGHAIPLRAACRGERPKQTRRSLSKESQSPRCGSYTRSQSLPTRLECVHGCAFRW